MNVVESQDSQSWEGMLEGRERSWVEICDQMAEVKRAKERETSRRGPRGPSGPRKREVI